MATKTKKPQTVDQVLDTAADILEAGKWIRFKCYNTANGGMCALGAIAAAVYPEVVKEDPAKIDDLGWTEGHTSADRDQLQLDTVEFFGKLVDKFHYIGRDQRVYSYNDRTVRSSKQLVSRLRNAAKAYRKQQEKA